MHSVVDQRHDDLSYLAAEIVLGDSSEHALRAARP